MAYNSNIPQASDKQNQSQDDILANFQALAPWGAGYGEFLLQASAPSFGADVDGIYTLLNGTTSKNELYVHKQVNGGTTAIPFTASKMSNNTNANSVNGWCYLPSGLLLKWGNVAFTSGTSKTVNPTTTSGGPNFSYNFRVFLSKDCTLSALNSGYDIALNGFTSATTPSGEFSVFGANTASGCGFSYLVIGV